MGPPRATLEVRSMGRRPEALYRVAHMDWAISVVGSEGPASVLLLFAERWEAEEVAAEISRRGRIRVCVRPANARRAVPVMQMKEPVAAGSR